MSRFYLNIIVPSILSILLFVLTIFLVIIPQFQHNIMNGKREMIRELTNSAWSILAKYENDEKSGQISREEAQNTAVYRIQYLRYGEDSKDYFWITDMHPNMVVHPYRPDLNGKDLTDFSDPHGKKLFVEFVRTVEDADHGYVDYMWQWKDDSLHIVPKLSYVRLFEPWGWVIGTGVYIEDVKKEIRALTRKLLWISVGISVSIAFLLLLITRNSLKIDMERIEAEKELHESREKYKTLVEAATEGLIMLIDGKISFANTLISEITGFENDELTGLSFSELISGNNNAWVIDTFSGDFIKEGQFELNLKKKTGGGAEVLITSSAAAFFDKKVNIIIVKDITSDKDINLASLDYQKLFGMLNVGFFRARIDSKGRFLFASETAVRILGYNNFSELSEVHILKMLASSDDRRNLRNTLLENGFVKNKVLKIYKKNQEPGYVSITLVVSGSDDPDDLVCDGTIMDITVQEKEREVTENLIAELKTSTFIIEQPVKDFLAPVFSLDADSTIRQVLKELSLRKSDNLLLTKKDKDYIGIITNSDIQNRVLSLSLDLDNPAYLIMSSPVMYARESTTVSDAINISEDKNINHLVVRNETGEITGVLRMNDVYRELKGSLSFYADRVRKAETDNELKAHYRQLQMFIKPLIENEVAVRHITNITSAFSDAVIRRLIELKIRETGLPPVGFSFICMGSEGRREETLYTDQDNAIIYEDVPVERAPTVKAYFNGLGEKVCRSLDYIGYSFCKGNVMAMNPRWCCPVSEWEEYFTRWITSPEPQSLLDASIFFDFRNVYGNEDFTESLRQTIGSLSKKHTVFLYHMAHNTFNIKSPQASAGNILSEKSADNVDLKSAVNLIVMFARTYALKNNLWCTGTIERLNALKSKQFLHEETVDELLYAYNFLMKLRFRNQVELSENKLPLSNVLNTKKMTETEWSLLKKILSQFPSCQSIIASDFRIST